GLTSRAVLLEHVPRDNIFHTPGVGTGKPGAPKWSAEEASEGATDVIHRHIHMRKDATSLVALGRKPAEALGLPKDAPFYTWQCIDKDLDVHLMLAPHPSGRSTNLHSPAARSQFRRALWPELVAGCAGLRPWHVLIGEMGYYVDIGAALSPMDVGLGMAVLQHCAEVWRAKSGPLKVPVETFRASVNVDLLTIARACMQGSAEVARLLSPARLVQGRGELARELKARAKVGAHLPAVEAYPVDAVRATLGRYHALGVL
ncbi:MAG: hypothetical protein EBS48_11540, partial [Actinobacteria bacterium]|nr:hypothetical protein [Actinomycetota bacterium]